MIPLVLFFEPGFCDSSGLGSMPNPQLWPGRINDGLANVPPDFFAAYNRRAPMSYH